jgi:hypothetical protein
MSQEHTIHIKSRATCSIPSNHLDYIFKGRMYVRCGEVDYRAWLFMEKAGCGRVASLGGLFLDPCNVGVFDTRGFGVSYRHEWVLALRDDLCHQMKGCAVDDTALRCQDASARWAVYICCFVTYPLTCLLAFAHPFPRRRGGALTNRFFFVGPSNISNEMYSNTTTATAAHRQSSAQRPVCVPSGLPNRPCLRPRGKQASTPPRDSRGSEASPRATHTQASNRLTQSRHGRKPRITA